MKSQTILRGGDQAVNSDEVLKVTTLLYLQEALLKEKYEGCKELIEIAKKFGAQQSEIKEVIAAYIRDKAGGQNGANRNKKRLFT
ncbi:MAG: hypothetical protein NUV91_01005 [Candidatus Omnitrophica bacterium]|nr:hypothetical protein [Candidatus Omnitrophota bacterium]